MRRGAQRGDRFPAVDVALNWHAPTPKGDGEAEELNPLTAAVAEVGALVQLLDRMEPDTPEAERASEAEWIEAKRHAVAWLRRMGEEFKASGLTAESELAASILAQLRGAEVDSSGLTAEDNEAAATSTTPEEDLDGATTAGPADGAFSRMLRQLGGRPA